MNEQDAAIGCQWLRCHTNAGLFFPDGGRVRRMSGRRTGIIVMITSTSMVAVFVIFMIFGPRLHSAVIHDSNAADEASADRTSFRSRQKQQLQPASGLPFLTLRSEPKGDQGLSDISSLWWNITKSESSDENKRELQSLGSSSGACGYHGSMFIYLTMRGWCRVQGTANGTGHRCAG